MELNWIDGFSFDHYDQLYDLYKNEWWTKGRIKEDVIAAFDNSDVVIGCLSDAGQLLACARILSDFTFKAFIFDVIVRKDARGTGLGEKVVERITTHPKLKFVRSFELYCPDHIVPFYQKFGFERSSSGLLKYQP